MKREDLSAAILAGGKSRRFGEDKALLRIDGQLVLPELANRLGQMFCSVCVIVDHLGKIKLDAVRLCEDRILEAGPLGGILTALENSPTKHCFVTACDMPFLDLEVVDFLLEQHRGEDAFLPAIGGQVEPLAALYSVNCIPAVQDCLGKGKKAVRAFWPAVRVKIVELSDQFQEDKLRRCFLNINVFPDDLDLALKIKQAENHSPR